LQSTFKLLKRSVGATIQRLERELSKKLDECRWPAVLASILNPIQLVEGGAAAREPCYIDE
jgi:hypothetical protein